MTSDTKPQEKDMTKALKAEHRRFRENIQDEINSAFLYRELSKSEKSEKLSEVYSRLAESEDKHAAFWEEKLTQAGQKVFKRKPSIRVKILIGLSRRFGPGFVLEQMVGREKEGAASYLAQAETQGTTMVSDEQSHQRLLGAILTESPENYSSGSIMKREKWHRSGGGNALRAAVLGANDGLVSNLSLVMGVAGANLSSHSILITGLAGLLAGAASMALGEWLSVQSSRELFAQQIKLEKEEIEQNPEEETEELALIYQAKGLTKLQAEKLAIDMMRNPETSVDTLAREELGIDPNELGGSAFTAALTSFCLFALGAIFPVAPFLFTSGYAAVMASLLISAMALFGTGAAITLFTGRSVLISGGRQVFFGLLAAAVTFGIGHLIGVSIG